MSGEVKDKRAGFSPRVLRLDPQDCSAASFRPQDQGSSHIEVSLIYIYIRDKELYYIEKGEQKHLFMMNFYQGNWDNLPFIAILSERKCLQDSRDSNVFTSL